MSHFIICSYSGTSLGIPNGHASTQLEQAIHRGFRADWTTPSSPILIASAGHTSAQVGSSQWKQTNAALAMEFGPVQVIEIDHGDATMRLAFFASLQAGLAADAARRIDVELVTEHQRGAPFVAAAHSGTRSALRIRHAETLNSGILLRGSSVRCVSLFALCSSAQWYGTNTVSGRIVFTTSARSVSSPRRDVIATQSPSTMPCCSARRG